MSTNRIQRSLSEANLEENYCSHLPSDLALYQLTLKGGHDSISRCSTNRPIDPDMDIPQPVSWMMHHHQSFEQFVKQQILNWGEAQDLSTYAQLMHGARYFDLRIIDLATSSNADPTGNDFYTVHGLVSNETLKSALQAINKFLDDHPQEFVILDCRSFSKMHQSNSNQHDWPDTERHDRLVNLFKATFDKKLTPDRLNTDVTPAILRTHNKQLIAIYHEDIVYQANQDIFWPKDRIESIWPNVQNTKDLKTQLTQILQSNNPNNPLRVCQAVLTPTAAVAIKGFFFRWINKYWAPGSLKDTAALVNPKVEKWMKTIWKDLPLNIVITDHMENMSRFYIPYLIQRNFQTSKAIHGQQNISLYSPKLHEITKPSIKLESSSETETKYQLTDSDNILDECTPLLKFAPSRRF